LSSTPSEAVQWVGIIAVTHVNSMNTQKNDENFICSGWALCK
jgi:hypothetical protein